MNVRFHICKINDVVLEGFFALVFNCFELHVHVQYHVVSFRCGFVSSARSSLKCILLNEASDMEKAMFRVNINRIVVIIK